MKFTPVHIGIPTKKQMPNEVWVEGMKIFLVPPEKHPFSYEFVRFMDGNPFHKRIQEEPHVAGTVDSIDEAIKEADEVLMPKFDAGDAYLCFISKDGFILELMESK